jgi:hypothetical protein
LLLLPDCPIRAWRDLLCKNISIYKIGHLCLGCLLTVQRSVFVSVGKPFVVSGIEAKNRPEAGVKSYWKQYTRRYSNIWYNTIQLKI